MSFNLVTKTLYHNIDTRMNLNEFDNLSEEQRQVFYPDLDKVKTNALAVACLMKSNVLVETSENYFLHHLVMDLSTKVSRTPIELDKPALFNAPLAESEKFCKERAPGFGSAVLVDQDKILTAGHCVNSQTEIDKIRVVFGFHNDARAFPKDRVYRIKRILGFQCNPADPNFPDWAVIKLDRPVVGIKPMKVEYDPSKIEVRNSVYALGCPMGTSVKCAGLGFATIKLNQQDPNMLDVDVDISAGNSGCPLIARESQKVIGIAVQGSEDFMFDEEYQKRTGQMRVISVHLRSQIYSNGASNNALCQKITPLMKELIGDFHLEIAEEGRKIRKYRSSIMTQNYQLARLHYIEQLSKAADRAARRNKCAWFAVTVLFPFKEILLPIALSTWDSADNADTEKIRQEDSYKAAFKLAEQDRISFKEAEIIVVSRDTTYKGKDLQALYEIAANRCAYNWQAWGWKEEDQSAILYDYDVKFKRRFSPEKIYDVMCYAKLRNFTFPLKTMKKILYAMQCQDPNHSKSSEERLRAVADGWVEATVAAAKKSLLYKNYSDVYLKYIATQYVEKADLLSFEQTLQQLSFPSPNL